MVVSRYSFLQKEKADSKILRSKFYCFLTHGDLGERQAKSFKISEDLQWKIVLATGEPDTQLFLILPAKVIESHLNGFKPP